MIYRELGKTGYRVSQLGFGAMRLPMVGEGEDQVVNRELAIPMLHRAFEAGLNYVDSAGKSRVRVLPSMVVLPKTASDKGL